LYDEKKSTVLRPGHYDPLLQQDPPSAPPMRDLTFLADREMLYYHPDDALAEVQAFLAATVSYGTLYKSTTSAYTDRKVAEAGWVLEASVNYLKNVNLPKPTIREITRTVEVQNYTDAAGELLISGTDLTTQFDAFITDLTTEENTDGSTAKLADARITSVTPIKTILEIKVDMGKTGTTYQPMGGGCELTIFEAAEIIEASINSNLSLPINCGTPNGPYLYSAPCEWVANVGNLLNGIFISNPIFVDGCSCNTMNPYAANLPKFDGGPTYCYPTDMGNTVAQQLLVDEAIVLDVVNWEIGDICSPYNCARDVIYSDCYLGSAIKLLSVGLEYCGAGGFLGHSSLNIYSIQIAKNSYMY